MNLFDKMNNLYGLLLSIKRKEKGYFVNMSRKHVYTLCRPKGCKDSKQSFLC